jgi:sec-independent protein translocase protein TatB
LPDHPPEGSVPRVFGVSFSEVIVIAAVALIVVGPKKLPELLNRLGQWVARLRNMTVDIRRQTGIDEILRAEGLGGGINELRSLIRGELNTVQNYAAGVGAAATGTAARAPVGSSPVDPYGDSVEYDRLREHPVEGVDAYGAIPEDLLAAAAPEPPPPAATAATPPEGDATTTTTSNDAPAQPGETKDHA